jgi:hypothetical protein
MRRQAAQALTRKCRTSPSSTSYPLALDPELARVARAYLAAAGHEVVTGDGLGTDEAALEVAMDHGRGLVAPAFPGGSSRRRPSWGRR